MQTISLVQNNYDYFFQTRDLLLNCHHVTQYCSENVGPNSSPNYKYRAVMEKGDELDIPKDKYNGFLVKMDSFARRIKKQSTHANNSAPSQAS